MRRRSLVGLGAIATAIAVAMTISQFSPERTATLNNTGGGLPSQWNQPYLAWPDTGDLSCETEEGPCGSPFKTLDPVTKALGQPLNIANLKVEVGKPGHHELEIGRLAFASGVHSRTYFEILNGDVKVYRVTQPHVEFRSLVAGAPPFTAVARDRARVAGVEPVVAILVWDVEWAAEGAVMEIGSLEVE